MFTAHISKNSCMQTDTITCVSCSFPFAQFTRQTEHDHKWLCLWRRKSSGVQSHSSYHFRPQTSVDDIGLKTNWHPSIVDQSLWCKLCSAGYSWLDHRKASYGKHRHPAFCKLSGLASGITKLKLLEHFTWFLIIIMKNETGFIARQAKEMFHIQKRSKRQQKYISLNQC